MSYQVVSNWNAQWEIIQYLVPYNLGGVPSHHPHEFLEGCQADPMYAFV